MQQQKKFKIKCKENTFNLIVYFYSFPSYNFIDKNHLIIIRNYKVLKSHSIWKLKKISNNKAYESLTLTPKIPYNKTKKVS